MGREKIKASFTDIADYWFSRIDECGLSVDASEAEEYCWRCGCQKDLMRCHIVPASRGGGADPSNLVILCRSCHEENPNVDDPEIMWDWLRAYGTTFYDTFWLMQGFREYEFIYNRSIVDEFKFIYGDNPSDSALGQLSEITKKMIVRTSLHFGQPHPNPATIAGCYRMIFKELANERGAELPEARTNRPLWGEFQ